jgi:hypothetical protein
MIEASCRDIIKEDGIKEVTIAMQTFAQDYRLQTSACCLLGSVLLRLSPEEKVQVDGITQSLTTLLTIMSAHTLVVGVQAYACYALSSFALNCGNYKQFSHSLLSNGCFCF